MNTDALPRKLAAILHADVVGFSRLTEKDEDATLRGLKECLAIFKDRIGVHRGRLVDHAGDSVLAIFGSAVDALSCAVRMQAALAQCNSPLPDDRKIEFRIGLNLGDVIVDEKRVYGDGVNVAARLQALAEPSGICVSGSVFDAVGLRLPVDYTFLGEQSVKNIEKPVRAYRAQLKAGTDLADLPVPKSPSWWRTSQGRAIAAGVLILIGAAMGIVVWQPWVGTRTGTLPTVGPAVSALPKIAVLPFVNRSDDPKQEYFADGVSEDIITDLSRLSGLVVVSRSASFRYKGTKVDPLVAGKELGADYLLEGSVRKAAGDLRITAQLVNTRDGTQMWAERYDRQVADTFSFQDDVTRNIVKAMEIQLTPKEQKQLGRVATKSFEAYDLFLQGQKLYGERTRDASEAAVSAYKRAIELDPQFARAYGGMAVTMIMMYRRGWTASPQLTQDQALELAKKAVEIDPESPQAYYALGYVHLFRKEYKEAADAVARSIELAPNYADGYGLLAFINNHQGHAEEAIKLITKAMELNPHYTFDYPWNLGWANYTLKRYPQAIDALKKALERNDGINLARIYLAASYIALGQRENAEWEIEQVRIGAPDLTISQLKKTTAIDDPELLNRLITHLREAGLPE